LITLRDYNDRSLACDDSRVTLSERDSTVDTTVPDFTEAEYDLVAGLLLKRTA
jgi:hypothetical protein